MSTVVFLRSAVVAAVIAVPSASMAGTGNDNAGNYDFSPGANSWPTKVNGGNGWGGNWSLSFTGSAGGYTGGSTNNDAGGTFTNINVSGKSFGIYSSGGDSAEATRQFGVGPLSLNQTFKASIDNGSVNNSKTVGFELLSTSNNVRFTFDFTGGENRYRMTSPSGDTKYTDDAGQSGAFGFTRGGIDITFKLTASNLATVTATRKNDNKTVTFSSFLLGAGTDIEKVRFFNRGAGNGSDFDFFFNSVEVPEPSCVGLVGLFSLLGFRCRRRDRIGMT